jgi:hypothetical protein
VFYQLQFPSIWTSQTDYNDSGSVNNSLSAPLSVSCSSASTASAFKDVRLYKAINLKSISHYFMSALFQPFLSLFDQLGVRHIICIHSDKYIEADFSTDHFCPKYIVSGIFQVEQNLASFSSITFFETVSIGHIAIHESHDFCIVSAKMKCNLLPYCSNNAASTPSVIFSGSSEYGRNVSVKRDPKL